MPVIEEPVFRPVNLRDGRRMAIRLATDADIHQIAAVHDLPTKVRVHPDACRAYHRLKVSIYIDAPCSGIVTGWVGNHLAGFQFYCGRLSAFGRFVRSPAGMVSVGVRAVQSGLLRYPGFIWTALRQARQHVRSPMDYSQLSDHIGGHLPDCSFGTLQTAVDFRQLGVGTALHEASSDMLRHHGNHEVLFWIAADNEASLSLHDKIGCTRIGVARRLNEDCWLLRKELG